MSLLDYTAVELAAKIKAGETTATEAMEAVIAQIEKSEDELNCYVTFDKEKALAAAKKADHIAAEGLVYSYIHGNGRIGVLVEVNCETDFVAQTDNFKALCKDIAMQIAAAKPAYLKREEVPADVLEHEKEVLRQQALNEGKPEKIIEKMVMGRIQKFYKENCLVDQEFVMDPDKTISGLLKEKNAKAIRFVRYQLGEGIEKKQTDFAAEVQSFIK